MNGENKEAKRVNQHNAERLGLIKDMMELKALAGKAEALILCLRITKDYEKARAEKAEDELKEMKARAEKAQA